MADYWDVDDCISHPSRRDGKKKARSYAILLTIFTVWMTALPYIPWTQTKAFFLDCKRIHIGMSSREVESLMSPYLEIENSYNGRLFKPYEYGGDICLIWVQDNRVTNIKIQAD